MRTTPPFQIHLVFPQIDTVNHKTCIVEQMSMKNQKNSFGTDEFQPATTGTDGGSCSHNHLAETARLHVKYFIKYTPLVLPPSNGLITHLQQPRPVPTQLHVPAADVQVPE